MWTGAHPHHRSLPRKLNGTETHKDQENGQRNNFKRTRRANTIPEVQDQGSGAWSLTNSEKEQEYLNDHQWEEPDFTSKYLSPSKSSKEEVWQAPSTPPPQQQQQHHPVSECYLRFEKIHMSETFCKVIPQVLGVDFSRKQIISLATFCKTMTSYRHIVMCLHFKPNGDSG